MEKQVGKTSQCLINVCLEVAGTGSGVHVGW